MTTKVDLISAEESQHAHSPISKATASGPKVSMFGVKSGFVIPKNKLSGSLVPIIRGGGKVDSGDVGKEESAKQAQRKTRWGDDLTQDAAVRKGRSLAYQTRLEQITQQLKSGSLELGEDQGSQSSGQVSNVDSVEQLTSAKPNKRELLELEKREVIGEILRLNPSYKAPPDYRPLLKEAKVPIPLQVHPGTNFIALILGPASNTQKRLEEETGAKIRVYGTKAETKEKCEITRSDASEAQAVYEELYAHISADTYEKVDAAVALIELLVTPVSAIPAVVSTTSSSVAGDSLSDQSQKDSTSAHVTPPISVVNQGMVQPMVLPAHSVLPQFQAFTSPWHPHGSPNVGMPQSAGVMPPSVPNNSMHFPSPINLINTPFSGGHPALSTVPRNALPVVTRSEPPMQNLQRPLGQATTPPSHQRQPPPTYPAMSTPTTHISPALSSAMPVGSMPAARPIHLGPQPGTTPGGSLYSRPLNTSSGGSSGFPAAPLPLRPNNMTNMVPPTSIPLQRPPPLVPQNNVALPPQPRTPGLSVSGPPAVNFIPRASFPHQSPIVPSNLTSALHGGQVSAPVLVPSSAGSFPAPPPVPTFLPARVPAPSPRPLSGPVSASSPTVTGASGQVLGQPSMLAQSTPLSVVRPPMPVPSVPSVQASIPASLPVPSHQSVPSISGSLGRSPSFPQPSMAGPVSIPPITSPKPQHPSPGDFTFQPHKTQVSGLLTSPLPSPQPVPRTISQVPPAAAQVPLNENASAPPLAPPKPPSFRPATQNPAIPVGMPGPPRTQGVGQMGPPQGPLRPPPSASGGPLPGNPTSIGVPPRVPTFLNPNTPPSAQVNVRNFSPVANASISIPSRPATLIQTHNQPPPGLRPHGLVAPSQHLASSLPSYVPGKPASAPGGSQIYDPFSPTSISSGPRQQEDDPAKARKPETDAEYEDLMASVGVR